MEYQKIFHDFISKRGYKMKKDDLAYVIEALKKRDEILINDKPVRRYIKYFDKMRKYARKLISLSSSHKYTPDFFFLRNTSFI